MTTWVLSIRVLGESLYEVRPFPSRHSNDSCALRADPFLRPTLLLTNCLVAFALYEGRGLCAEVPVQQQISDRLARSHVCRAARLIPVRNAAPPGPPGAEFPPLLTP